eukprot:13336885-Alexandrium_andersonii.AAC.1
MIKDHARDGASAPPEKDHQGRVQQLDSTLWQVTQRVLVAWAQTFKDSKDKGYFEASPDQLKSMSAVEAFWAEWNCQHRWALLR